MYVHVLKDHVSNVANVVESSDLQRKRDSSKQLKAILCRSLCQAYRVPLAIFSVIEMVYLRMDPSVLHKC